MFSVFSIESHCQIKKIQLKSGTRLEIWWYHLFLCSLQNSGPPSDSRMQIKLLSNGKMRGHEMKIIYEEINLVFDGKEEAFHSFVVTTCLQSTISYNRHKKGQLFFAELFERSFARGQEKPRGHRRPIDPIYGHDGKNSPSSGNSFIHRCRSHLISKF